MSRSRGAPAPQADDIWTKLQKSSSSMASPKNKDVDSSGATAEKVEEPTTTPANSSLLFVGDLNAGKSTIIQTFLKPSATKDTKPTIALEYNYARRTANGVKQVANLWEIGGDLVEPKLMEIGITLRTLANAVVIVCVDLSKPHNVLNSVLRAISAVKEISSKRAYELQASNVNQLNDIRERNTSIYKGHVDENRIRPLDVPLCIVANKHDQFRSLPSADRRVVMQVLRFVAHFFGAHLVTASNADSHMRDVVRSLISSLAFSAPVKPACELNSDKLVHVTRGEDSFERILLGQQQQQGGGGEESTGTGGGSRGLVANESEMGQYVTHKGVTRDCWSKLSAYMASIFGEADPLPSDSLQSGSNGADGGEGKDAGMETGNETRGGEDASGSVNNPFPEPEVDDMREVRDTALAQYIQDTERREGLKAKMNARA